MLNAETGWIVPREAVTTPGGFMYEPNLVAVVLDSIRLFCETVIAINGAIAATILLVRQIRKGAEDSTHPHTLE